MRIIWDEPKRWANIAKHGLDFADLTEEFFLLAHTEVAREGRLVAVGEIGDVSVVAVIYRSLGSEAISVIPCGQRTEKKGAEQMAKAWPSFVTVDLDMTTEEGDAEMQRRWIIYDQEMKALIAAGGVHQDEDGWWVDDATGDLIGPDPEIERPLTDAEAADLRPLGEVLPELAENLKRGRGRPPVDRPKRQVTLRLDVDVLDRLRSSGKGWQGRVNDVLKKAVGL